MGKLKGLFWLLFIFCYMLIFSIPITVKAPTNVSVVDYKYDDGDSIIVKFRLSPDDPIAQLDLKNYKNIDLKNGKIILTNGENKLVLKENIKLYSIIGACVNIKTSNKEQQKLLDKLQLDKNQIQKEKLEDFIKLNFEELKSFTPFYMMGNIYDESKMHDKSLKDKFRLPYLKSENGANYFYIRLKRLNSFKNHYIKKYEKLLKKTTDKAEIKKYKQIIKDIKKNFTLMIGVKAISKDGIESFSNFVTIKPHIEAINMDKIFIFLFSILFVILMLYIYHLTRKGKNFYIRPIAGLSAVEEAVGRATEMGKPVLYISGLSTISDIATLASINILGQIAKKVALYETPLIVPAYDPIVYTVLREVVREAYVDVGKPEAYQEENVFYLTSAQFAYAAGVNGIMVREKPATVFYMGMFFVEALLMSETGNQVGAIQIAGTDAVTQIPFFITTCDYTLIGEELYAASAYLSREPLLLSTLKVQDYGKAFIMFLLVLGVFLEIAGIHIISYILQNIPD